MATGSRSGVSGLSPIDRSTVSEAAARETVDHPMMVSRVVPSMETIMHNNRSVVLNIVTSCYIKDH